MRNRLRSILILLTLILSAHTAIPAMPVLAKAGTIKLTSPKNGASVSLIDKKARKWYKSGKKIPKKYKKEHSNPVGVTLRWKNTGGRVTLTLSADKTFTTKKKRKVKGDHLRIYNLRRDRTYYWKVTGWHKGKKISSPVFSFRTKDYPRLIRVKGVSNIRDLGGYRAGGGRVKQGMIYRSASLDFIRSSGKKTMKKLGIKTDLDLRKVGEGSCGTRSPAGLSYIHIYGVQYERIEEKESKRKRLVKICKVFAKEKNYPIVFHCTYGRDRTGTLAFVINGLLGVSKSNLYKDYAFTFLSKKRGSKPEKRMKRFDKLYRFMASYKDGDKSLAYNIESFLLDYGMTKGEIAAIKTIMIEKTGSGEK